MVVGGRLREEGRRNRDPRLTYEHCPPADCQIWGAFAWHAPVTRAAENRESIWTNAYSEFGRQQPQFPPSASALQYCICAHT